VGAVESAAPSVGRGLIGLVTTRDEIADMLLLDDVIDLVIPRGSNELVRSGKGARWKAAGDSRQP
jgi:delta-1-pyrroline-5-carboxylate synthetase